MLVHSVFFKLKDTSSAARDTLIAACKHHLSGHPGTVFFSVGGLESSLSRPVNDRDFDVALHVVFQTLADHDAYQNHPRHLQFIEEHKNSWAGVRVFDSSSPD